MINPKCERTKPISIPDDFTLALKKAFSGSKAEKLPPNSHYPLYVGEDLISQLKSPDNQIIWGRRGTGKTHLLKAFNQCINEDNTDFSISYYISCDKIKYETPIAVEFKNDFEKMKYCARNTFKCFMTDLVEQIIGTYEEILNKKNNYKVKSSVQKKQTKKKIEDALMSILINIYEGIPVVLESTAAVKDNELNQKTNNKSMDLTAKISANSSLSGVFKFFKKNLR